MKHTFRTCLVCLLLVVFCCLTVCGAGADYFVSYPGGDSDIVIKGTAGVEKANRQITMQVIREGISVSSAAETDVLYMRQVMTDVNGEFSFTFTIADRGEHSIRISDSGTLLAGQPVLYRSTESELSDAVAKLNAALNNADAMDMVINGNSGIAPNVSMMKVLQIDSSGYASLKADTAFLRNLASKTYESVPEFMSQYKLAKLLVELSRATNGNTVKTLLAESDNAITFAGKNAGLTFAGYNESDKNAVYETMATKNYSSVPDVQNALYEAVIVNDIAAGKTYQAKFSVIEHNNDVLGLDMTKCTSLGAYVEGFKSELASQPLNSLASIRTSFDTLYLKHLGIKNNAENKGGSGSSGGVGGGGPAYIEVGKEPITPTPSYYFKKVNSFAG